MSAFHNAISAEQKQQIIPLDCVGIQRFCNPKLFLSQMCSDLDLQRLLEPLFYEFAENDRLNFVENEPNHFTCCLVEKLLAV